MSQIDTETKSRIIAAGRVAIDQLIEVAKETILKVYTKKGKTEDDEDEDSTLTADKLKNAAAAKKLAIFDAFEILNRIEEEQENLDSIARGDTNKGTGQGFAEKNSSSARKL